MTEYFGIIATGPSGSTAAMELISGKDRMTKAVASYIDSEHTVRLFRCVPVEYDVEHGATVVHLNT